MKYLLPLILLPLFVQYSCKKTGNDPVVPDTTTTIPDPVDTITGMYIGNVKQIREEYNGLPQNPVYTYDTTYYIDTVIIVKQSKDSFSTDPAWKVFYNSGKFKYNSSNEEYTAGYGINGTMETMKMKFYPGTDSLYIHFYGYAGPYSGYVKTTREFFGKK